MKYSDRKTSQCILPFNELFELNKRVNTEATAHLCSADVFKNQMFYKYVFLKISQYSKENICIGVFNEIAEVQLFCEYCKFFKSSFFHKKPQVNASEKFINFPGKRQRRRRNIFIFLIHTTE